MARKPTPIDPGGRSCTVCKEYKPWDEFHKQTRGMNGHEPRCKLCRKETARQAYIHMSDEQKEQSRARLKEWRDAHRTPGKGRGRERMEHYDEHGKVCTLCKTYRVYDEFGKSKSSKDGKTSWCSKCLREKASEYAKANPDKVRERSLKWYHANKEKHYEDTLRWKKENPERNRELSRNHMRKKKAQRNEAE